MNEFKIGAMAELNEICDEYTADADKQVAVAKTEFKKMFTHNIIKLHNLNNLDELQRMALREIINERQD